MNVENSNAKPSYVAPEPRRADTDARLEGRSVELRPIIPQDYDFIYALATSPGALLRWRHRGMTPPPEHYADMFWQGVLAQFLVARKESGAPVGVVSAYSADPRNQCVSFAMLVAPKFERRGWAMEASFLFIDYLFRVWNFRKIYIESIEFNVRNFWSGAGSLFQVEGCLRHHEYHDGRWWHVYLLAIYRDDWIEQSGRLLPRDELKLGNAESHEFGSAS